MIAILACWTAAAATFSMTLDLDELAARSDAAVLGEVSGLRTVQTAREIWTIATVQPAEGDAVEVRLLGGCVRDLCMTVPGAPRMVVGEEVFVFLRRGQPTGFSQGLFHVRAGAGESELSGAVFTGPSQALGKVDLDALIDVGGHLFGELSNTP
jgi:hypothetical protein